MTNLYVSSSGSWDRVFSTGHWTALSDTTVTVSILDTRAMPRGSTDPSSSCGQCRAVSTIRMWLKFKGLSKRLHSDDRTFGSRLARQSSHKFTRAAAAHAHLSIVSKLSTVATATTQSRDSSRGSAVASRNKANR